MKTTEFKINLEKTTIKDYQMYKNSMLIKIMSSMEKAMIENRPTIILKWQAIFENYLHQIEFLEKNIKDI